MTRDASTQTRTILIHLNVQPSWDDGRAPEEIAAAIGGAIEVGRDDESCDGLDIQIAHYEEV